VGELEEPELEGMGGEGMGPMSPQCGGGILNTFCQYTEDTGAGVCAQSMQQMMQDLQTQYGDDLVRFIDLDTPITREGRHVYGLRVGKIGSLSQGLTPQVLVVGALRAREWAGSGMALELARRMASMHENLSPEYDWVRELLDEQAITFVPVANPDGYAYTISPAAGARDWVKNREPCTEEAPLGACGGGGGSCPAGQVCFQDQCYRAGVDLASNFGFNWRNTARTCSHASYEGPNAGSEPEVQALAKFFLDEIPSQPLLGDSMTRFLLSYGGYGNYILYPDGITDGADGGPHSPCRTAALTPQNCQPPELPVLRSLLGSQGNPILHDQSARQIPYAADTLYRSLEATVGDPLSHFTYSPTIEAFDPLRDRRALSASVLLSNSPSGASPYYAECMDPQMWSNMVDNQIELLHRILANLRYLGSAEGVARPPELGDWAGRRIHRLRSDQHATAATYGPPRFWVDQSLNLPGATITPQPDFAAGTNETWGTAGLYYRTVRWKPTADYTFPGWLKLCPSTGTEGCEYAIIDGGTPARLCSVGGWRPVAGWAFQPQDAVANRDDCYWNVTGRNPPGGADATFELRRAGKDLSHVEGAHLDYSYRIEPSAFTSTGRVQVAVRRSGGNWVTVRTYPASRLGRQPLPDNEPAATRMRTEHVELPAEFNRAANVEVRVRAIGILSTWAAGSLAFRIFDVVLVGRPATERFDACIDRAAVAAADPPGQGDIFDVPVVSGVENPGVCATDSLGDLTLTDGVGESFAPWGNLRRYTVEGEGGFSNEAFLQSSGSYWASRGTDDPFYANLRDATENAGDWTFEIPGVMTDSRHPRTLLYTTGDPPTGWTPVLTFPVTMDRRVRSVPVTVYRLLRESDLVGANVNSWLVSSWFGEDVTEVISTDFAGQFWGRELEQYKDGQWIDDVFSQCDIEGRLQFQLTDYEEVIVADFLVDSFDMDPLETECDDRLENLRDLQFAGHKQDGSVNVYLVRSWGTAPGGGECGISQQSTEIIAQTWNEGIVMTEDRLPQGGRNTLAHELWHFMAGPAAHCGDGVYGDCVEKDLMAPGSGLLELATITPEECRYLTSSHAQNVP
jgi:hypothetical protein